MKKENVVINSKDYEKIALNSVMYADPKEIASFPSVKAIITHQEKTTTGVKVTLDTYFADVVCVNYLLKFHIILNASQYGLIALSLGKDFVPAQFTLPVKARLVRTDFSSKLTGKDDFSTYAFEAVFCDSVKIHKNLDTKKVDSKDMPFLTLYHQLATGNGQQSADFVKNFPLFVRVAGVKEVPETPSTSELDEDVKTALD